MPSYSYKISGDHPQLARFDKVVFTYGEMVFWKRQLLNAGYDNVSIVQTDLATGNQVLLPLK